MSKTRILCGLALLTALAMATMNPATAADRKTTNTIIGAGIGAAAGAVLSQGDTLTTLGGAAAGGLLGHILTEEPRRKHRHARPSRSGPPHYADHRHQSRHMYQASHGKGAKHSSRHRHHGKRHAHR